MDERRLNMNFKSADCIKLMKVYRCVRRDYFSSNPTLHFDSERKQKIGGKDSNRDFDSNCLIHINITFRHPMVYVFACDLYYYNSLVALVL